MGIAKANKKKNVFMIGNYFFNQYSLSIDKDTLNE